MTTDTQHNGTIRSEFESDFTRLNNFSALTSDPVELLHKLIKYKSSMPYCDVDGSEGTLEPLLKNHVLTVLSEISRKNLEGDAFADAQGTAGQNRYVQKLERNIREWMERLENYLHDSLVTGNNNSQTTQLTRSLYDLLKKSLPQGDSIDNYDYYKMYRTVVDIQHNTELYIREVEQNGDTEPALALLLVYLRNYSKIADTFNQQFASLPSIFYKDILHCEPKQAVPDNVYLVVNPAEGNGSFNLPKGTSFTADENLIYKTTQDELISPVQCVDINAICNHSDSYKQEVYRQILHFNDPSVIDSLFHKDEKVHMGWQLESPMFILNEGERRIHLRFLLSSEKQVDFGDHHSFVMQYSSDEGWTSLVPDIQVFDDSVDFSFVIETDGALPMSCTEEEQGMTSVYPVVRLLTDQMNQMEITFSAVEISAEVRGIRNFILRNELGGADTTQPFSLFGIEAERGSWFTFGNEEMSAKPLKEVCFRGKWKKMPETRADFVERYEGYGIDIDTFRVSTEYLSKENWNFCSPDNAPLISFDEEGRLQDLQICFNFPEQSDFPELSGYREQCEEDVSFRATLIDPKTGFGSSAYRRLFSQIMIYNSHCEPSEQKLIPQEPLMPMVADVELCYTTAPMIIAADDCSIKPIMFSETPNMPPREGIGRLLPKFPADNLLYFAFAHAEGQRKLRLYIDLVLPPDRVPFFKTTTDKTQLNWSFWNGKEWKDVPLKSITIEETDGFKQSGFIEINLDVKVPAAWLDHQGKMWLRVGVVGNIDSCLGVRGVWTNCIKATAEGGDGNALTAETITKITDNDVRIKTIAQPLSGFGGVPAETDLKCMAMRTARLHNRHRAILMKDYEEIILEHFPEVEKVQCFSMECEKGASKTFIVVFSRQEDNKFFLSSPWKLTEMKRKVMEFASPFASIEVINPVYKKAEIFIKAKLRENAMDEGQIIRHLTKLTESYVAPWLRRNNFPNLLWNYSYNALRSRIANHEDVERLLLLTVNGKCASPDNYEEEIDFGKYYPWDVLLPQITIELVPYSAGIGEARIEENFEVK